MASIFGYTLGVVGSKGGHSPNATENTADPSDFTMGSDIIPFMGVSSGTTLTNRMGDTWTFGSVSGDNIIESAVNSCVINGKTYSFRKYPLFLGMRYTSSRPFVKGSYMFVAYSAQGNPITGHPTRVANDGEFLAASDSEAGWVEYINGVPQWTEDYVSSGVWQAFAVFCAREISFETQEDTDPYGPGGGSGTGGGTGNFDGTSEDINIPNLPTLSAVDTGFISLFNPTAGELKNLANYLWGDVFDISTWKKIFANPMDAILGLSIVPVNVPSSGSSAVTIGNISTGVSMTKASSQYVSVDCGTINVNEYWGAYLDYSPYTQAEIYLPFIGIHPLTIDDIMGKPVHVVYHIDILSGACCAYVKCGGSVLYSFVGQCSCSIPITANDWTNVINGALSIAGAIGSMVASGGATAPMAISSMASTAVNSLKPNVEKSGSMGGMGGMLGVQKPYIILTRPKQALPAKQNMFTGYPSYITKKLSDCSGYTEVESIHLENVPATDNELTEITDLLKSGVII